MKQTKEGANESSTEDTFIPKDINTLPSFRDKPVIVSANTAMFFFKKFKDKEIWFSIEKTEDSYYFSWIRDNEHLCREIPNKASLSMVKTKRDNLIMKKLIDKIDEIDKSDVSDFLEDLGLFLVNNEDDIFNQDQTLQNTINGFDDYPEHVQEEARQIVKNNPFKFFEEVINITHKGDTKAKRLVLLSIASLFVKNAKPVHQGFKGTTGVGKTSITNKTAAIVPERYIQKIRDTSPKYIYYAADSFNPEHNIFLFDDVVLNDVIIELLKTITDNETKNKVLKTVIEQKAQELKIPGNALVLCTVARDILNTELDRRLMYNNPKEDEDHTREVKEMIKTNSKLGFDLNNEKIKQLYLIANAVFELLIKNPIKVYNPYLEFMNLEDKNYTDIEHFSNLVKARTLYFQEKRYKIDDIVIGNIEDLKDVTDLWGSISAMQNYKIDMQQIEFLKKLPLYNHEHFLRMVEAWEMNKTDFNNSKNYTCNYLAKELNVSKSQVEHWVYGRKGSYKQGLEELGLVKPMQIDPEKRLSPKILYFNENKKSVHDALNSDLGYIQIPTNDGMYSFKSLKEKRDIIIGYLLIHTEYNVRVIYKNISQFLENHPEPLESDEDVYIFLKSVMEYLKENVTIKKDTKESYKSLIESINYLFINSDPVGTVGTYENTIKDTQIKETPIKRVHTGKSRYLYVPEKAKKDRIKGISKNVLNAAYEVLKFNQKGIINHGFRADLQEALKEDNYNIIFEYEEAMIKQGYILFDKGYSLISPTDKLLSLFKD